MVLDLLLAGDSLLGLVLGDALQHFDLHMMLVDLALQSGSAESMAIPVQQQSRTLGSAPEAAAASAAKPAAARLNETFISPISSPWRQVSAAFAISLP